MKKILAILPFAALLFAACDKIEPGDNGEYTIFAGATASWMDGTAIANPVHRALVEKYTGPKCVNCPTAAEEAHSLLTEYPDNLVVVAMHPADNHFTQTGKPEYDYTCPEANDYYRYFGGTAVTPFLSKRYHNARCQA